MPAEVENALRARIAALEAEVEQLRGGREEEPPRDREKRVELLVVDSEEDLFSIPAELALQILDALPVQVFIKRAAKEALDGSTAQGRRYTFLNQMAAGLAGWPPNEAAEHLDCEAMVDQDEYMHMDSVETQTIHDKKRYDLPLRWTSDDGSWRVNRATHLPVLLKEKDGTPGRAIGFCAIAHDIEFNRTITATRSLMWTVSHEVANLAAKVGTLIRLADRRPADMDQHLRRAAGWADASAAIAEAMLESYDAVPLNGTAATAQSIVDRLRDISDLCLPKSNGRWSRPPRLSD